MKHQPNQVLLAFLFMLLVQPCFACLGPANVNWVGTTSDWEDPNNYSSGSLPNEDRIIINPANYTVAPAVDVNSSFTPYAIRLESGGSIAVNAALSSYYVEFNSGANAININEDGDLRAVDFRSRSSNGNIILEGDGTVAIDNLILENQGTQVTNNLNKYVDIRESVRIEAQNTDLINNGTINVGNNLLFATTTGTVENNGTFSVANELRFNSIAANSNTINNNTGGVLIIDGDFNFNGSNNTINNAGTVIHAGNLLNIDDQSNFNNLSGGIWNWNHLGGGYDPNVDIVFDANGTVHYGGAGDQEVIPIEYSNLAISGSGNKRLQGAVTISGTLSIAGGFVELGEYNMTIGSNGTVTGASSNGFVVTNSSGALVQNNIGAGGRTGDILFPVGTSTTSYTPVVINNTSGIADNYDVRMCTGIYEEGDCATGTLASSFVVNRTWLINEAVAGGSDVTLTLQWNAANEMTGFDRSEVNVLHHTGTFWEVVGNGMALGSGPYTASATGLTSFSPYGIEGAEEAPLPVELLYFEAESLKDQVELRWETATEVNNDFFTIERSTDLKKFEEVVEVGGKGTTSQSNLYTGIDRHPYPGTSYYRLKQTDFDGRFSYSGIVKVLNSSGLTRENVLHVYPVPSHGDYILFDVPGMSGELPVNIYDMKGRLVHHDQKTLDHYGGTRIEFKERLPRGIYLLKVDAATGMTQRFNIE